MGFSDEHTVWVPLPCGTRLAARVWWPEGTGPWPAVLEYLPYRRADQTSPRDDSTYPAYAEAGIVGVRVDSRGHGDSDGLVEDEYAPQELSDAAAVIDWIAAQDWSHGSVGMMGISWGGFNALQVAAMRPPALKAVISIASTADRYNDDIHYKNGCHLSANVSWSGTMLAVSSRPPDPDVVGDGWREMWKARLAEQPFLLGTWLAHQRRDAYWQHGSICDDWSAITCPAWLIAGWADGYSNTPATVREGLQAPCWAMTGPWIHKYPHFAWPRPRADFIGQSIAWWRHWLCGEGSGVESWPDHATYRLEGVRPGPERRDDTGTWIDAAKARVTRTPMALGPSGLLGGTTHGTARIATPQHCGVFGGEFFTVAPDGQLPADQRGDDGLSICWDTPALEAPLDLSGRAELVAQVAIDHPQGNLIARLVDVHPDGTAALIARGVLNLSHRGGNAEPRPMTPGQAEEIRLVLDETCYRLRPGHRLRLAVSTAYWPLVLPSPTAVVALLSDGHLHLPVATDAPEIAIAEPADPDPLPHYDLLAAGHTRRWVEHDLQAGRVRYHIDEDSGLSLNPNNAMEYRDLRRECWEIDPENPADATGELTFETIRQRAGWHTRTSSTIRFRCAPGTFDAEADLLAEDADGEVLRKSWNLSVPRDHM